MDYDFLDEMVDPLPYPIAALLGRVVAAAQDKPEVRCGLILDAATAVARFLGVLSLCECAEWRETAQAPAPRFFDASTPPTFARWIALGCDAQRWLLDQAADRRAPEAAEFFFDQDSPAPALLALEGLCELQRKLAAGELAPKHKRDYEALCDQAGELLEEVLRGLAFLEDYELLYVDEIQANRRRKTVPLFEHQVSRLHGAPTDFKGAPLELTDRFKDSQSVLLQRRDEERYLNLDPLLVHMEPLGKAQDFFFFDGNTADAIRYAPCRHGEPFETDDPEFLDALHDFETLLRAPNLEENGQ